LIEHLEEIQVRMLYAELGYASLWEFAIQELGLSEGSDQRRIQAMRLMHDVPEAKQALEAGRLTLSNAAKLQSFRQAEKKRGQNHDGEELVARVSGLSQRECERALFEISPEALPRERERVVSALDERELKIVVSADVYEKLQRIRGLWAHAMPEASYAELLARMAEETLERLERARGLRGRKKGTAAVAHAGSDSAAATATADDTPIAAAKRGRPEERSSSCSCPSPTAVPIITAATANQESPNTHPSLSSSRATVTAAAAVILDTTPSQPARPLPAGQRVYLPAPLKQAVWARARGQCEITRSRDGRRCSSRYRLDIDHVIPLALNGSNELSNLRLACRIHNRQQAREKLGEERRPASSR
jgi:hypothetical protein